MIPPSDLAVYYQILELPTDATVQEIKIAYRRLARRYHPDVNKGDRAFEARFKQVALAYQTLITALKQIPQVDRIQGYSVYTEPVATSTKSDSTSTPKAASGRVRVYVQQPHLKVDHLSSEDKWLKLRNLNQVYHLMKRRKWQQVLDLVERLALRFPGDPDVSQWQAVAYYGWARKLIDRQQYGQARIYLKKALQTEPHNRQLWDKIEQEYKRIERRLHL